MKNGQTILLCGIASASAFDMANRGVLPFWFVAPVVLMLFLAPALERKMLGK